MQSLHFTSIGEITAAGCRLSVLLVSHVLTGIFASIISHTLILRHKDTQFLHISPSFFVSFCSPLTTSNFGRCYSIHPCSPPTLHSWSGKYVSRLLAQFLVLLTLTSSPTSPSLPRLRFITYWTFLLFSMIKTWKKFSLNCQGQ